MIYPLRKELLVCQVLASMECQYLKHFEKDLKEKASVRLLPQRLRDLVVLQITSGGSKGKRKILKCSVMNQLEKREPTGLTWADDLKFGVVDSRYTLVFRIFL